MNIIRFPKFMIYLVDMDGVIVDFEKGILDEFRKRYPDKPFIPLEKRTTFYVRDQYPKELQPLIDEIYRSEKSKGFYLGLSLIEGALDALLELKNSGNEIYICTSPTLFNPFCISEKYEWINNNLGTEWTEKVIMTRDKTVIDGNFLIDDNPNLLGVQKPRWKQILYSQPYNRDANFKQRLTWQNWKFVLNI